MEQTPGPSGTTFSTLIPWRTERATGITTRPRIRAVPATT
jgi:hypothetical protein